MTRMVWKREQIKYEKNHISGNKLQNGDKTLKIEQSRSLL